MEILIGLSIIPLGVASGQIFSIYTHIIMIFSFLWSAAPQDVVQTIIGIVVMILFLAAPLLKKLFETQAAAKQNQEAVSNSVGEEVSGAFEDPYLAISLPKEVPQAKNRAKSKPRKPVDVSALADATHATVPEGSRSKPSSPLAQEIVKMFQNPQTMRQAIVLHEILGPPKSLASTK